MKPSPIVNGQLYHPNLLTNLEFVGPNSLNPSRGAHPSDWNNFGPAVGFAWQAPWKTTLRGGDQITFQRALSLNDSDGALANAPGSSRNETYTVNPIDPNDLYLDLTDITPAIVPLPQGSTAPC